ncbi:DNA repair protein SWI5 homolog [Mesocricetus auratus]|uniref:DNA repair protein SWI5 homolog n=1 Tax=Mesocricetus auratus TaxID=10036 RepID=A0ABM2WPW3_MESAU|nr:DNA repair protein SWI5 homolog [Mesocricetus auratus]
MRVGEAGSRCCPAGATGGGNDEGCARSRDPLAPAYQREGRGRPSLVRAQLDVSRTELGFGRSCHGAFRSPCSSPKLEEDDDVSEESLNSDIQKLKEKRDMLDKEISQLVKEGYRVGELEDHISLLHEYNDIKDVAQMLLGKLALTRGVTTKELYPDFGLELSD